MRTPVALPAPPVHPSGQAGSRLTSAWPQLQLFLAAGLSSASCSPFKSRGKRRVRRGREQVWVVGGGRALPWGPSHWSSLV